GLVQTLASYSQSAPYPRPADVVRARPQKDRAAPAHEPSSGAPYRGKSPSAERCSSAREIQRPRRSRSRIKQKSPESRATYSVLVHNGDVFAAGSFQQFTHTVFGEPRIARFNCTEKTVVARVAKTFPIKHGVVPAGQSVHAKHREKCGEGPEENR